MAEIGNKTYIGSQKAAQSSCVAPKIAISDCFRWTLVRGKVGSLVCFYALSTSA